MRIRVYPGQYFDEETGLHYNYHRYYDTRTGRYLTPDPIGLIGWINPYIYGKNNPINAIDPYGLDAGIITIPLAAIALAKAAVLVGSAIGVAALVDHLFFDQENEEGENCEEDSADPLDDYPADPDEWNPPEGWEETPAGEETGGRHRQWRGPNGELRKWDREGRPGGKKRGPHWHDPRYPGKHIDPTR
ncbi:MAG: RHS repeat-associated core domain-containing protein [Thermodesulfobacteriota bacterium]|nr:RHS repeat-associated core domain-containing protein [Thermodesulfobacteriota bacterium]